jgi:hypothetical protein
MAVIVLLFLFFLCGTIGRKLLGLLAVLADALVHDVGDLDGHRPGIFVPVRSEAGGVAHRAVHVLHAAAADADGVVVVVADAGLVQGGRVRRLEAAQHVQVRQVSKDHVDGLGCQLGELTAGRSEDALCGGMGVAFDGGEYREPLLGHPAAVGAKGCSPRVVAIKVLCHGFIETLILTFSQ